MRKDPRAAHPLLSLSVSSLPSMHRRRACVPPSLPDRCALTRMLYRAHSSPFGSPRVCW